VLHEHGAVAAWAASAAPGDEVAVSGTGRGYAVDPDARSFLLGGDESAIPAISVLLEVLPATAAVQVVVEVAAPDARLELPAHPGAEVRWCDLPPGAPRGDALHAAVTSADLDPGGRVWVAGEAAAVQRIRATCSTSGGSTGRPPGSVATGSTVGRGTRTTPDARPRPPTGGLEGFASGLVARARRTGGRPAGPVRAR
jgi:NADPH-dependent ferric siderophore reductase